MGIQTGCGGSKSMDLADSPDSVSFVTVSYGPELRQQLDIYRPLHALPNNPVIVFFYGGGWRVGKKADYDFVGRTLAEKGFVTVVADYRLYPQVRFPVFVEDAATAVAWVAGHIGAYGGNAGTIFLAGHSTGAYLAAMLGVDPGYLQAAGYDRNRLAGWIGIAGPYDPKAIRQGDILDIFAGSDPEASFPALIVHGRGPKVLLIEGLEDDQLLPANSEMAAALRRSGTPVNSISYKGVGHIGIMLPFTPLYHGKDPGIVEDIIGFATGANAPR